VPTATESTPTRALSPAIGVVLLVALTAALAGLVGASLGGVAPPTEPTGAALSLSVEGGTLRFVHRGGDALDVRDLRLRIAVDGEPLDRQPPVPFFAASGFGSGPSGPFNAAADPSWTAGEAASLRIAATNDPTPEPGATVRVTVFVDGRRLAELTGTA